jgi:hypothetical protein
MKYLLLLLLLLHSVTFARSFLPENDLYIPETEFTNSSVTRENFFEIIRLGYNYIQPVANRYGETVTIESLWENGRVNADVRREGNRVVIRMYGGLARYHSMTNEGFALVLAHEMAHAYCWNYNNNPVFIYPRHKLCSEGNADYDGIHMLQWIISGMGNMIMNYSYTPKMFDACNKHKKIYGTSSCIVRLNAGLSVTRLLADLVSERHPSYDRRDRTIVRRTQKSYPETVQCRLDNYWDGMFRFPYSKCWYRHK